MIEETENQRDRHGLARWIQDNRREEFFWLRIAGGLTGLALAAAVAVTDGVHETFLLLVGIAVFVFAFPWQRLSSLKAGPFELSLEQGQIEGAVNSIQIEGDAKDRLRDLLARLKPDIERARGSRVLWVDDSPFRVVGERRLLRALDIETVSVPFSRDAAEVLRRDNDFDLVVTSLYKSKEKEVLTEEREDRKLDANQRLGALFVQWLRGDKRGDPVVKEIYGEEIKDTVVNNLPVVFYVAAISMATLRKAVLPAAELGPGAELSQKMEDFLKKTIRMLADARSDPIPVPVEKEAPH